MERAPLLLAADLHKSFRLNICLLQNKNFGTPQSIQPDNEIFPNSRQVYFPTVSTIAYMVVSIFDWVLLGSSVIGSFLGYSVVGSSLGSYLESLVIGSSLGSSVIASSVGSSFLVFWYAVCHQLHQQLEGFYNVLNICFKYFNRQTDILILSL